MNSENKHEPHSLLRVLAKNSELLIALSNDSRSKFGLANELDMSKKTVYRRVRELIKAGFVVKNPEGYELTAIGRLQMELISDSISLSELLNDDSKAFSKQPDESLPPYWFVIESVVSVGTKHAPDIPLKRVIELIDTTEEIHLFLPAMFSGCIKALIRKSDQPGFTAEVVVNSGVVPSLQAEYASEMEAPSS